jgi:hypothetical protein
MENFDIKELYHKEIKVTCIDCYKGIYIVNGIIDNKYYIYASNRGEYRYSLEYKPDEKFTLKSFDYAYLKVSVKDKNNEDKTIYTYDP